MLRDDDWIMAALWIALGLLLFAWCPVRGQEAPRMDPDSLSWLIRVDDLRQVEPPADWAEDWNEVSACLTEHDVELLPVAFSDYSFWVFRWAQTNPSAISDLRGLHIPLGAGPRQIFIREDYADGSGGVLKHEIIHALAGDEVEHCDPLFLECAGFLQNWCPNER